jgi:hypothetical protein
MLHNFFNFNQTMRNSEEIEGYVSRRIKRKLTGIVSLGSRLENERRDVCPRDRHRDRANLI